MLRSSVFKNKKAFLTSYKPSAILHRDEYIEQIAKIIAPILKFEKPSNLFIYGKTGSGKTLSVRDVLDGFDILSKKNQVPVRIVYLNCKLKGVTDTEYRLIAQLAREFGKVIPATGLPTEEVYKMFFN